MAAVTFRVWRCRSFRPRPNRYAGSLPMSTGPACKIGSLPLIHIVRGVDPSTGARPPAIGVIAIGQVAMGVVAIGQLAVGGIAIGQAALGLGWGIGQLATGILAAGQVAAGAIGSVGQVALGPQPLGLIEESGPWAAMAWLAGGVILALCVLRRLRTLGPLVSRRAACVRYDLGAARRLGPRRSARGLGESAARAAVESAVRLLAIAARRPGHSRAGARGRRDRRRRRVGLGAPGSRRRGRVHQERQLHGAARARLVAVHGDVPGQGRSPVRRRSRAPRALSRKQLALSRRARCRRSSAARATTRW